MVCHVDFKESFHIFGKSLPRYELDAHPAPGQPGQPGQLDELIPCDPIVPLIPCRQYLKTMVHWIGFKGKSTGNHGFYHEIWGFPVKLPVNQSNEW